MSTVGTNPPGWYTDPDDPGLIRYWDGGRWSERTRPRPAWAPAMGPEEAARHEAAQLRRRQWWARGVGSLLLGTLVVLTLFALRSDTPAIPPRTVGDRAFTDAANRVCAAVMPGIRTQPPQPGGEDKPPADEAFARRVERTSADLAGLVGRLRTLPVAEADRAEVEAWFAQWDRFVEVGHRYAAALRRGNPREFQEVGQEGDEPTTRIYTFARANGMPECAFRA